MKVIKGFLYSMLSEKGPISSKRCIATSGTGTLIWLTIYSQITDKAIDHHVFDTLVFMVLSAAGIAFGERIANAIKEHKASVLNQSNVNNAPGNTPEATNQAA